jgi:hypothetical protein
MVNMRKLPVGIQDFEKLRTEGYLYVDKTEYICKLLYNPVPYFLGRPRRFGKSLFLSMLKAFFEGKKELFENLKIAGIEKEWKKYPIIYIDLNQSVYTKIEDLEIVLNKILLNYEELYGKGEGEDSLSVRFGGIIQRAVEQTGNKVVVLVDEYDKPLLGTIDDLNVNDNIRNLLKGFYGTLKSSDAYLKFVFLTGVTKFSKVSVFSDLNQLVDIGLNKDYAGICGISEKELLANFQPEINVLAKEINKTYGETLAKLKQMYDGYHFVENTEGIYNPFSLLNTFFSNKFSKYWFQTGTPTFLVKVLKNTDIKIEDLEKNLSFPMDSLTNYKFEYDDPIPLLYQTGYLTIKKYDERFGSYVLGFPNEEVKYGFYNELLPAYVPNKNIRGEFYVVNFIEELMTNNIDAFMTRLTAFFADIPYHLNNKEEKHYQTIFFIFFRLMGQFINVEYSSSIGRCDAIIELDNAIFIFEFKLTEKITAEDALKQIDMRGYATPYLSIKKPIFKIGVKFSEETRTVDKWVVG